MSLDTTTQVCATVIDGATAAMVRTLTEDASKLDSGALMAVLTKQQGVKTAGESVLNVTKDTSKKVGDFGR